MVVRNTLAFTKVLKMPYKKAIPDNPKTLGEHILRKRLLMRLLQKHVAEQLGVTEASVTGWENGRSMPMLHVYPAIIAFLGYYPFDTDISTVSGQIEFVRYNLGWSYERMSAEFGVDGTTVQDWFSTNRIYKKSHQRILSVLLKQSLSI